MDACKRSNGSSKTGGKELEARLLAVSVFAATRVFNEIRISYSLVWNKRELLPGGFYAGRLEAEAGHWSEKTGQ